MTTFVVYASGACKDGGRSTAAAGWGVHFPTKPELDAWGPLHDKDQTSNRAELWVSKRKRERESRAHAMSFLGHDAQSAAELHWQAIYKALDIGLKHSSEIKILTDSTYCVSVFTDWIKTWSTNGWRRANGKPIGNGDLIRRVWTAWQRGTVTMQHCMRHGGHPGGIKADE